MRLRTRTALALVGAFALALSACGGDDDEGGGEGPQAEVVTDPEFPEGSQMAELSDAGTITIGTKYDQPGTGFLAPGEDTPSGFDVEMGEYVAGQLGIAAEDIEWKQATSENREAFLQNGTVDLILATYSIDPERRAIVGQAGPYYITGQQLLVREEDKDSITGPDALDDVKTCSVTGSTSLDTAQQEYGADPVPFDTYSACVRQLQNETVDAVTTDGAILAGYAAQDPDNLEVVGDPFSEERYAIGYYPKDDTEMCQFLNGVIEQSYDDGYWNEAFEATLGESGIETPEHPTPDPCA
jgi:glutamate transport system substrate-binding protein